MFRPNQHQLDVYREIFESVSKHVIFVPLVFYWPFMNIFYE